MPKIKNNVSAEKFANSFLLIIVISVLILCYLLFKPFLNEIIMSSVLVTIFYPVYLKLVYWTKGKITLSAMIMCLLISLILIIPIGILIVLIAFQVIEFYPVFLKSISTMSIDGINSQIIAWFSLENGLSEMHGSILDIFQQGYLSFFNYAKTLVAQVGLTFFKFFASLVLMVFTMFFLFRDGRGLLRRIMELTPLSNKYDKLIWKKFRDVSYTSIVASVLTSLVQTFAGMLAFWFVGLPVLLPGVLMFFFSFLPYIGTSLVWFPLGLYLLVIGNIWQGIFLLVWGVIVISLIDNIMRPYLIKDKAQVHELIIFFSIFGGMTIMGIWGLVFGPLIVALAVTILHIYELEYEKYLDR